MGSLLPMFMILLILFAGCHKHEEEFVPVPGDEPGSTDTPPGSGNTPPVKTDTARFESRMIEDMPYRFLRPIHFDPAVAYPMFVFLHGMGERGRDNESQLKNGSSYFLNDSIRQAHPAFIVFPQCPTNAYWFDGKMATLVKTLIDSLREEFNVDSERISVGGFSMGAYGTFEITSRYPGYFEAAVAISGDGDASRAQEMAKTRWRIFAGGLDDIVPSSKSRRMAEALSDAGASVAFTLYPRAKHDSTWLYAFSEPDFFSWVFLENNRIFDGSPVQGK